MDVKGFWDAVLRQDADEIREYFHPGAWVNWHIPKAISQTPF